MSTCHSDERRGRALGAGSDGRISARIALTTPPVAEILRSALHAQPAPLLPQNDRGPRAPFILPIAFASLLLSCAQPQQPAQPSPSVEPKYGGTISVEELTEPTNFDFSLAGISRGNQQAIALAYNSLLTFKTGPEVEFSDLVLQPEIAGRWEVTPDARRYTFHLREGVKFANMPPVNGREVTSADIKWNYEYHSRTGQFKEKHPGPGQFAWMFEGVERIEAPDPATVVVHFEKPFAPFLSYAGSFTTPIQPKEIYERDGHFKDDVVGTGPFQLDRAASQRGTRWVFKRNPNFFRAGLPYLNEVRWLLLPDITTTMAAFQTKQLDIISQTLSQQEAETIKRQSPEAQLYTYNNLGARNLYMNQRRPPFNDERVRKAIGFALDRDEIIKTFSGGRGQWAVPGLFPGILTQEEIKAMLRYDPEEAKRLLAQAGHGAGLDLEFFYPGNAFGEVHVQESQLIQAQFKKVGINLTFKSFDLPEYLSRTRRDTYDITLRGTGPEPDVDAYLYAAFHPDSQRNYQGVNDPKLTELLEAQRREPDPAKRREIWRQAGRYLTEHALGLVTYNAASFEFQQGYVRNYRVNGGRRVWPLAATWLDK